MTPEEPRVIIGLTGHAQHGKDSIGQVLVEEFGFWRYAFADQLKSMALVLNPFVKHSPYAQRLYTLVQDQGWDLAKKNPEVRRFLQVLGTEAVRDHLGEDAWIDALAKRITDDGFWDSNRLEYTGRIVVTDVRFPNEAEWVREVGELWRVKRTVAVPVDSPDVYERDEDVPFTVIPFDNGLGADHPSEAHVDSLPADLEITATSLKELQETVRELAGGRRW